MYVQYDGDDDCDCIRTRGEDLRNRLRLAAQAASRVEDPSARDAVTELVEAMRLVSQILYDVSEPPMHRVLALDSPYSLS